MQTVLFTTLIASLAAFASATPEKRQIESVSIYFYSPSGEKWSQTFPTDLSSHTVETKKVVSHIYNPGGAICSFLGVHGEHVDVPINDHKLENPQVLKSGSCSHL